MYMILVVLFALAQAATIQWTGQGGTNLWDNLRNWDCNCLPSAADDVVIAFSLGPASIRLGSPAKARSLTIGGTQTQFFQTLTVSSQLIIADGTLNTNGILAVETAPTSPFNVSGTFNVYGRGFSFTSGLIGGNGTVRVLQGSTMNFTGPASKEFGGGVTLSLEGEATIFSSSGSSLFLKESSTFKVSGALISRTGLDMVANNKAAFTTSGKGQFTFDPASSSSKLILQGGFVLDKWAATQGTVTVLGKLNSGDLTLGQTVNVQLVGGPDEQRVFQKVTGGTILQQGGNTEFSTLSGSSHSISSLTITGGNVAVTGNLQTDKLTINGGNVAGPNPINANSASLTFAVFVKKGGLSVANSLELLGQVTLDSASLITLANSQVRISGDSQLIFQQQSSVTVRGQVFQTASLKLVRASLTGAPPTFLVEQTGSWTTGSLFNSLGVPVSGLGSFSLDTTARFDFSNANFGAGNFASKGFFTYQQGNFSFQTVTGTGNFTGAPESFVATSFAAANFSLVDGTANFTKANIQSAAITNGVLSVSDGTFGDFDLKGGLVQGIKQGSQLAVANLVVTGVPAKTLQSITVTVSGLSLSCGAVQCAFFTTAATLQTQ